MQDSRANLSDSGEQKRGELAATTPKSLLFLGRASRVSLQNYILQKMAAIENGQRAAADILREVLEAAVAVELGQMIVRGELEQVPREIVGANGEGQADQQRAALRVAAEAILQDGGGEFEPWFRPRPLSDAILRRLRVDQRKRWAAFFKLWGCIACKRKDREHGGNGLCNSCRVTVQQRLKELDSYAEGMGLLQEAPKRPRLRARAGQAARPRTR